MFLLLGLPHVTYLVDCGLQIWRMTDLLYRPEEEVLAELQHFKDHVIECTSKA